jgi:hypothetical protein
MTETGLNGIKACPAPAEITLKKELEITYACLKQLTLLVEISENKLI